MGFWNTMQRVVGVALIAGVTLALGGCGVAQTEYDALKAENEDLRGRIASSEAASREQGVRMAELEAQKNAQNQVPINTDGGRVSSSPRPFGNSESDEFRSDGKGNRVLDIAGEVLFDSGQAVVKAGAKKELDRVAKILNARFSGKSIRIEGHTDNDPIKKSKFASNDALSEARAQAVRGYLVSKGVSSGRVSALGLGSSKPKGSKKESRRVEIVVVGG